MLGKEWLLGCACVATAMLLGIAVSRPNQVQAYHSYIPSVTRDGTVNGLANKRSNEPVMIVYEDPHSGFSARIPAGWRSQSLTEPGEIGFTVSFESPPSDSTDVFADYLMVEIQPDSIPASFDRKPDERVAVFALGKDAYVERITLDDYPVKDTRLDLVVWQLFVENAEHTIAAHAVGEKHEDARLERILIDFAYSFELLQSPFQVVSKPDWIKVGILDN